MDSFCFLLWFCKHQIIIWVACIVRQQPRVAQECLGIGHTRAGGHPNASGLGMAARGGAVIAHTRDSEALWHQVFRTAEAVLAVLVRAPSAFRQGSCISVVVAEHGLLQARSAH